MPIPAHWKPWRSLPGCDIALSMDTNTYAAGTWTNQTGVTVDFDQSVAGNRPTAGVNYLDFDGSGDHLDITSAQAAPLRPINGGFTLIAAVRPDGVVAATDYICQWRTAPNNGFQLFAGAANYGFQVDTGGLGAVTSDAAPAATTTEILTCWRDSGNVARMRRNGAAQVDTAAIAGDAASPAADFSIGATPAGGSRWDGRIYCLLLWRRDLTALEKQQVEYWIDQKFSLGKGLSDPGYPDSDWRWRWDWS